MKKRISTILLVLVFMLGLLIMLYPTISNVYNERVNSYVVEGYIDTVNSQTEEAYALLLEEARAYNDTLPEELENFEYSDESTVLYESVLDVADGIMGYLVIDKIDVNLAISHGTDSATLQKYVGHLEGSPLPTGDIGNNTVLTGHTGLPSAELLTNLTQMEIGDTFEIVVLNEVFTYEVFAIEVIDPNDLEILNSIEGKDVVSLVTCTPYGVNSHRLVVQGERIDTDGIEAVENQNDITISIYIPRWMLCLVLGSEMVLILGLVVVLRQYSKGEKQSVDEKIANKFRRQLYEEQTNEQKHQKVKSHRVEKNARRRARRKNKKL